jgi:hypothetical protein
MPPLRSWISPFDPFATPQDVVNAAQRITLTGFESRVLLPTMYGAWYQGTAGVQRTLGAGLVDTSPAGYAAIRASIEALGTGCDGWSVPTDASQGYAHGAVASVFDHFVLNFEHGWAGFWTPEGPNPVNQFMGDFWRGVQDGGASDRLNGNVGVTMVTNSAMMHALSDAELQAWVGGSNYDALEAYIPGDPGLDPANSQRIWQARLAANGIADRNVVLILEQGDLPALCAEYANPVYGVQLWTLGSAMNLAWPAPDDPAPDPVADPTIDPCQQIIDQRDGLESALGYLGGDLLKPVSRLRLQAQPKSVQDLVAGIRKACDDQGISHV